MSREWGFWSIGVLIFVFGGFKLTWAETDEGLKATSTENNKTITAVKTDTPPLIDGQLKDDCWKQAPQVTGFIQKEPHRGEPATQQTIVYVLYDDDNLYIGFVCQEDKVAQLAATQTKHDAEYLGLGFDDCVEVLLDTYHDGQSAYRFMLNPLGCQLEGRIRDEGAVVDSKWDCLWQVAAVQNDSNWTAEIAIPFSALSFPRKEEQTWGINFVRREKPYQEVSSWVYTGDNLFQVSKFGELIGLLGLKKTTRFTLTPTLTGRYEHYTGEEDQYKPSLGLDSKVAVTSNLFFDLTVNPDFAHIEADQDQFNLSYQQGEELYLVEKRLFFLESLELFESPIQLLYTRRMNEIAYGGKLTGKIGGLNLGLLDAQTKDTDADSAANFSGLRLKQDIFGSSSIGLLAVDKEKREGQYSRAGGLDCSIALPWEVRLSSQIYKNWNPEIEDQAWRVVIEQQTDNLNLYGAYEDIGDNFEVESGYITEFRKGRQGGQVIIDAKYWTDRFKLKWINPIINYERRMNLEGELVENYLRVITEFLFQNKLLFSADYAVWDELTPEGWTHSYLFWPEIMTNYGEWAGYSLAYLFGYNYGEYIGMLSFTATKEVYKGILFYMRIDNYRSGGSSEWIQVLKVEWPIGKKFFFRSFLQNNTGEKTKDLNFLLGYNLVSGGAIYCAYNEKRMEETTDRIVFVKVAFPLSK